MAQARCDGSDPNLLRQVPEGDFDSAVMKLAGHWQATAEPGCVVIQCQCGLLFDDTYRMRSYPHEFFGQLRLPGVT